MFAIFDILVVGDIVSSFLPDVLCCDGQFTKPDSLLKWTFSLVVYKR